MHELYHESAAATLCDELVVDGRRRAALNDAPHYMQCFYEILSMSYDTYAIVLAANTRYDSDLAAIWVNIAQVSVTNQDVLKQRSVESA